VFILGERSFGGYPETTKRNLGGSNASTQGSLVAHLVARARGCRLHGNAFVGSSELGMFKTMQKMTLLVHLVPRVACGGH
jgi:hypothetical protein